MLSSFSIKTPVFEGPLDVLLDLIEKRKLLINDISLSQVTDEYINYIHSNEAVVMGNTAHFILIASTLLLIKSKSLLPTLSLEAEEEVSIRDLEQRLAMLAYFRNVGKKMGERFGVSALYTREKTPDRPIVFSPGKKTTILSLAEAISLVVQTLPKKEVLPKVLVQKVVSLEDMISSLSSRIERALKLSFADITKNASKEGVVRGSLISVPKEARVSVIVGFLAILELVKQGIVRATQENREDDISLEHDTIGLPRYE